MYDIESCIPAIQSHEGGGEDDHMTGTTESPPMDVAEEARQQHNNSKKELDRNESVRARVLAISQIEPVGEALPLEAVKVVQPAAQPSELDDGEDEVRRKLMSISYVDTELLAQ